MSSPVPTHGAQLLRACLRRAGPGCTREEGLSRVRREVNPDTRKTASSENFCRRRNFSLDWRKIFVALEYEFRRDVPVG